MEFTTNSTHLGPSGPSSQIYILCTLDKGQVTQVVGPVFANEIEVAKMKFFHQEHQIKVMHEDAFRSRYPLEYNQHSREYWMDKLFVYCVVNQSWLGTVRMLPEERLVQGQWFMIFEKLDQNNIPMLEFHFRVGSSELNHLRLRTDVAQMIPKMIYIGEGYHYSERETLLGTKAVQRYLSEQLIKTICLQ
jgi:hypothetical protein